MLKYIILKISSLIGNNNIIIIDYGYIILYNLYGIMPPVAYAWAWGY